MKTTGIGQVNMNRTDKTNPSAVGLDLGTSRIVAARQTEDKIKYDIQLNAFLEIPFSKMTANVLRKEAVPHAIEPDRIYVHGNESERFADLLNKDVRRPMSRGLLNPEEPESTKLIREIVANVVGAPEKGQKLYFTVPAAPAGAEENLTYHEAT